MAHAPLVLELWAHHVGDQLIVFEHLRPRTHLPHALRADEVVLVRVLVLVGLEPELHVADGVVRLDRDGVEDALACEEREERENGMKVSVVVVWGIKSRREACGEYVRMARE